MLLHVGIDDTDSPRAGCTTHVAAVLVEKLLELGANFVDYPNLIRLNPNVPWKTRGNGAVCLRLEVDRALFDDVVDGVAQAIETHADVSHEKTDPGAVFLRGEVSPQITRFSSRVVKDIVELSDALELIESLGLTCWKIKEGRGVIGALAAIGEQLSTDHTFELITYRKSDACGTPRGVDPNSVVNMAKATEPATFDNVDPETKRVLITPRGPDPVLYGIRGETPEIVRYAQSLVKAEESIDRWIIFRTNHGTDFHFSASTKILQPYRSVVVSGEVASKPQTIQGSHVLFRLRTSNFGIVQCATYEPTGQLRDVALRLLPGDEIEVYGAVRPPSAEHGLTINLEKIKVVKLKPILVERNPVCPYCGKRMKSLGRAKGFRCKRCKIVAPNAIKIPEEVPRRLREVLYIASPRAHRHLTKPYSRYGREKSTFFKGFKYLNPSEFFWSESWSTSSRLCRSSHLTVKNS